MTEPSRAERVAFEIVRRVLGAQVEHHDTAGRQRAVDGLIKYNDGSQAALEVTLLTDSDAYEVETMLARDDFTWQVSGCSWWWTASLNAGVNLRRLRADLPDLLRWCEAHSITRPRAWMRVQHLPDGDRWRDWLETAGVALAGHPDITHRPGEVMVTPASTGGAVGDVDSVASWLDKELARPRTRRKVAKLADSGLAERHLFLVVDYTGAPFPGFYALAWAAGVPAAMPELPGDLARVWLAPRWSQAVLTYDVHSGWERHEPYDG